MSKAKQLLGLLETIDIKLGDYITGKNKRDRIGQYVMFGGEEVGRYYFKDKTLILDKPYSGGAYGPSATDTIRSFADKNNMKLKINW